MSQHQQVGPDGIAVQIDGDNNNVTLYAGAARLVLDQRHRVEQAPPANDRELLLTELRAIDLVGRDSELAAIQEAAEIRRGLVAARPDAFGPDLATSRWVLADRLDETGDQPGGLAANVEAIAVMAAPFRLLPAAHSRRMSGMVEEYVARCETLGREPDMNLLAPVLAVFQSLQQQQQQDPQP